MHTIVDTIPFLLHASLLLFFAGLVAFLLPVNPIMMYIMCIALVIVLLLKFVERNFSIRFSALLANRRRYPDHDRIFADYLLNEYILFLSSFLRDIIPASAKTTIPAFNGDSISYWTGKFKKKKIAAILAYTQSFEPRYASGWGAVQKKLWSCDLF
ncbi:hypothetical protein B0H14DRAFT_2622537 [Mycena olivaceomarginata]|nr:hypothetical protein B0H14DRAFT_2622537 [Mycena olivaceomarginata]